MKSAVFSDFTASLAC